MKKIFAIYAKVRLINKPTWLDGFCIKYNQPYDYHITLIQCRYISDADIPKLKEKVDGFFSELSIPNHKIEVDFSIPNIDSEGVEEGEGCFMIEAQKNDELINLQKSLVKLMGDYKDFYKPKLQEYEKYFQPHITVAMYLNEKQFLEAKNDFKDDFQCIGVVDEIVLSIVKEITPEESKNPNNLTIYKL